MAEKTLLGQKFLSLYTEFAATTNQSPSGIKSLANCFTVTEDGVHSLNIFLTCS